MKRLLIAILFISIIMYGSTGFGADSKGSAFTDGSATVATTHYVFGYNSTTNFKYTISSILGLKIGTVTNTDLCVGDSEGVIQCTVSPSTYTADSEWIISGISLTAGSVYYMSSTGLALAKADSSTTMPAICIEKSTTVCRKAGKYTTTGLTRGDRRNTCASGEQYGLFQSI